MIKVIGVKLNKNGKIDDDVNIIVLNHNSMLDVILLEYLYPKELVWVANKKLSEIPVFGMIFKIPNLILIDPSSKSSVKNFFSCIEQNIQDGKVIALFPEGTRGKNNKMQKFRQGLNFVVKDNSDVKIQPIVLCNTRYVLDTQNLKAKSGEVKTFF